MDEVVLTVAGPADVDAVVTLLATSFAQSEPLCACLGLSVVTLRAFVSFFAADCCASGLSLVGRDRRHGGRLACVAINRDFKATFPAGLLAAVPEYTPIIDALGVLDHTYERVRPALARGEALDLWMIAVDATLGYGGRGLATRLVQRSVELARSAGFRYCVSECTAHYSQLAMQRNAFREMARIPYSSFRRNGGGEPVFPGIQPPHTDCAFFELDLKDSEGFKGVDEV